MRAGRLRHKVRFERAVEVTNSFGEPVKVWQELIVLSAGIEPLRGNERFNALQVKADEQVRIVCRWCNAVSSLNPKDRAVDVHKGTVYDITAVINLDERNKELNVMAKVHI